MRALDADGIVVPVVNSWEEAERAAFATRYPPGGYRSRVRFGRPVGRLTPLPTGTLLEQMRASGEIEPGPATLMTSPSRSCFLAAWKRRLLRWPVCAAKSVERWRLSTSTRLHWSNSQFARWVLTFCEAPPAPKAAYVQRPGADRSAAGAATRGRACPRGRAPSP
jgi:hypothetical protein